MSDPRAGRNPRFQGEIDIPAAISLETLDYMKSSSGGVTRIPALALSFLFAGTLCSQAIIVGGTLGTGNNNADESSLQGYLSTTSYSSFGYWNNLVRVNDASGVYLGYNPSTMTGWVLSAAHINAPASIGVAGNTYNIVSSSVVGTTDLILYEIGGLADPGLPTVSLASTTATPGEFLLMTGRGYTNSTTDPYPWGSPGATDAIPMRWGTNTVNATVLVDLDTGPGTNLVQYINTTFTAPASPGATPYEGQAAVGDSGGGMFIYRGGQWVLAGIAHFVDDPSEIPTDPAEHDDLSYYTDIFSNRAAINAITGTLIPEPSAAALLPLAAGLFCSRRRRK